MAQMYDPRYPVCMQVYILDGKWVDKALGRAARCRCPTLSHAAAFVGDCWTHRENMHLGFHATRPAYVGTVDTLGLNIGATSGGRISWAVYAPAGGRPGMLAGDYSGAATRATVGAGAKARRRGQVGEHRNLNERSSG